MAQYDIVAVGRVPAASGVPSLVEVGPLFAELEIVEELDGPGEASLTMDIETLDDTTKSKLRDLSVAPMEVWIYRDGDMIFAGPVIGGDIQGTKVKLTAKGLLYYLQYMLVETNVSWSATDQFTIVAALIDYWQTLAYGHYGLVTAGIGTAGQVRDLSIPGATEPVQVSEIVRELGAADNGFDMVIDPKNRTVDPVSPAVGSDLSGSVFLEVGIESADIKFSVAPGLVASEIALTATYEGMTAPLSSTAANAALRASFGRCGWAVTADNVSEQALADDLAQAQADARATAYFQPGGGLIPVAGAGYTDFGVGDTVTYSYDAGIGLQTGAFRVIKRTVSSDLSGTERLEVAFE